MIKRAAMPPQWLQLLGPHAFGAHAVVKRTNVAVDDVLLEIEAGHVGLDPAPPGANQAEAAACVGYARAHLPDLWRAELAHMGARLCVGKTELRKAFHRHAQAATAQAPQGQSFDPSRLLLGVYAVECGLKSLLLHQRGLSSTREMDDSELTHDLNFLSVKVTGRKLFPENLGLEPQGNIGVARLHEALRYGHPLRRDSYRDASKATQDAISHIEENFW